MKCKICYAQLQKSSTICSYCGTPITLENHQKEKEKISRAPNSDLDRLSPEFRQILESSSSKKTSADIEEQNLQFKESYEDLYNKNKPKRKWGIGQSVIEFLIYGVIISILDGYGYEELENIVTAIYLIRSILRAVNFFSK